MALTREQLKEMQLSDEQIEAIIKGHAETVTGLTRERDELKNKLETAGDAAAIQAAFDAYRAQAEADKLTADRLAALRGALREAGVKRDDFVDLLTRAVDLETVVLEGGRLQNAEALIGPLKASYGGCFAVAAVAGTEPVNPPSSGPAFTREQLGAMTEQDINRHWSAVQAALGQK